MVTTRSRSMSGTTKTVKPPPKAKVVARKSGTAKAVKPPPIIERNPARMDAMSIFMIKEYMPQYFETNGPITSVSQHEEVLRAGHVKWFYMSDSEKAPWIELNEEMNAQGCFLERDMHVPPQFWERMVTTRSRSMSGTTKTVKPPPKAKVVARKSGTAKAVKPPPIIERNPARMDAMSIFMIKEYMPQYFETNGPITSVSQHEEVLRAGHVKWFYMSDSEKAPWIELNEEMNAQGCFLERVMHVPPQFWERFQQRRACNK